MEKIGHFVPTKTLEEDGQIETNGSDHTNSSSNTVRTTNTNINNQNIVNMTDINFSVYYMNIQCMRNKVAEMEVFLNSNKVDLVALSEHWLKKTKLFMLI